MSGISKFRASPRVRALICLSLGGLWPLAGSAAPIAQHAYVRATGGVFRFPIVNGLPSRKPDLEYPGVGGPIGIGPDGTFYATIYVGQSNVDAIIEEFAPGTNRVERMLALPYAYDFYGTDPWAIAVDSAGYIFVSYSENLSGIRASGVPPAALGQNRPVENGIGVYEPYGPNADSGLLETYHVAHDGQQFGARGLAFGPNGDLYATMSHYGCHNPWIDVIQEPVQAPKVVRAITGRPLCEPTSITFDEGTRTFSVLDTQVFTYSEGANGKTKPLRSFFLPPGSGEFEEIASTGPYLLATRSVLNEVMAFHTGAEGHPHPAYTLSIPNPTGVTVGP